MSHAAPDSTECHNCGATLHGGFCAACGQQALPLNPSLQTFLHEFGHELLHLDGKIFGSIRRLLGSPGYLTKEQFEGRRVRWVPPIRLYLIFSVLYFALSSLNPSAFVKITSTPTQQDAESVKGIKGLGFADENELREVIGHAQATWVPRVMFVLVPLFAWLVRMVTKRTSRNYPQHLYFALHMHAAWFAAGALAAAAKWGTPALIGQGVGILATIYAIVYAVLAFRRVYGFGMAQSILKAAIVMAIYWVAVIVAVAAIIVPPIFSRMPHS